MEKLQSVHNEILQARHHNRPFIFDARYMLTGKAKPVVVFIHGFKGFKDWGPFNLLADVFAREGFVFVKLNLSHNGTTPENPTEFADLEAFGNNNFSIELNDVGTLLDYLSEGRSSIPETEADFSRFFLIGHSRGGGLAILKTNEDKRIHALTTWSAINDVDQRWPEAFVKEWKKKGVQQIYNSRTGQQMPLYFQIVEDYYQNKERLDIPTAVKNMEQPHLIIHGTADETVPVEMAKEMKQWNLNAELFLVEGANHTFGGQHPSENPVLPEDFKLVIEKTIGFFRKHL